MKKFESKVYEIIFEADTKSGKAFDIALLWLILVSLAAVCLESMEAFNAEYGAILSVIEWILTTAFTLEYILRVYSMPKSKTYIFSFYGLVDLLAILPAYLGIFVTGANSLVVIRSIRILRIFRLMKLSRYVGEAETLKKALVSSKQKITIFLLVVLTIVIFMGAVMYLIEGKENGFVSIPKGMYWAVVTMTTVGYGDLVPQTDIGKFLASFLMIMGYAIIAVPTGIVTAELTEVMNDNKSSEKLPCPHCGKHPKS
jgi:voltage-gated potassium channel